MSAVSKAPGHERQLSPVSKRQTNVRRVQTPILYLHCGIYLPPSVGFRTSNHQMAFWRKTTPICQMAFRVRQAQNANGNLLAFWRMRAPNRQMVEWPKTTPNRQMAFWRFGGEDTAHKYRCASLDLETVTTAGDSSATWTPQQLASP